MGLLTSMQTDGKRLGEPAMTHASADGVAARSVQRHARALKPLRSAGSLLGLMAATWALGGCSESLPSMPKLTDLNPFAEKQQPMPGKRVAVVSDISSAGIDLAPADRPMAIAAYTGNEAWMQPGLKRKARSTQFTIVCALPLYHVFAFVACSLLGMRAGARNILVPNPRDQTAMIAQLLPYKLHMFPAVNTLFGALLQHPDFAQLDFSELCISNGGGSPVQAAVASRWLAVTGCPITEGYGLSETAAAVVCNRTDLEAFTGDIGLPMPGVHIRMLDLNLENVGQDVPLGQPGEIAIHGPQVMAGYWKRPEDTAAAMTADGYFLSGDIGVMDAQGHIRIIDRKKDMLLVSGFNVYPNEIEAVLAQHPGVLECAAVGVPDAVTGEAVKLVVVKKDPAVTEADLLDFCAEQLTGYKRPRKVEFIAALPRSALGKVLRRELRTV